MPKGQLRIDIGSILANRILVPSLGNFRRRYPDIDLLLGVSDRPADLIGEGIDCVIRGGFLADSSLKARKLCELDYVLCAAPSYLAAKRAIDHPDDITGHQVVSHFSAASGKRFPLRLKQGDERVEHTGLSGVAVNESTAHLSALIAGLGVGQTFGHFARPYFKDGTLVELLPDWKPENHTLHLLYPADRFPNPRLRIFIEWAAKLFEEFDAPRGGTL